MHSYGDSVFRSELMSRKEAISVASNRGGIQLYCYSSIGRAHPYVTHNNQSARTI
jgi:hypothetical protein